VKDFDWVALLIFEGDNPIWGDLILKTLCSKQDIGSLFERRRERNVAECVEDILHDVRVD
jgi:hypothetical protein